MNQVVGWVGGEAFEGLLILDECHLAANLKPGKDNGSKMAKVGA